MHLTHLRQTLLEYLQAKDHGSSQSPVVVTMRNKNWANPLHRESEAKQGWGKCWVERGGWGTRGKMEKNNQIAYSFQ